MSDLQSKKQILKSTGILGSVQVITILIGILRVKVLALLLGPVGIGVAGIYQMTISIISSATSLGINFSGVREIASAAASQNESKVARTLVIIKRWAWFTGVVGMFITLIFCKQLSRLAFDDESYSSGIAILSITLFLSATTGGLNALLQGMRKIKEIAKANIFAALIGLAGTSLIYYSFKFNGIVPALLFTFFSSQIITWYFARKVRPPKVELSLRNTYREGLSMAKLGSFMAITTLFNYGCIYAVRYFIIQKGGLELVGHFVAAWTISTMYISTIFGAMGADYFPRLSAVQDNHISIKRLVNEQTEIAILLAAPIIIGMISFVAIVVKVFYSKDFDTTAQILNWQLLGDFIKVLGYPLGYVLLAKGKGKLVIFTELVWNVVFLGIIFIGWKYAGIEISGIAFLIAYVINFSIVFFIVKKIAAFSWSSNILRYILFFVPILIIAFLNTLLSPSEWQKNLIGTVLTIVAILYSFSHLKKIMPLGTMMQRLKFR